MLIVEYTELPWADHDGDQLATRPFGEKFYDVADVPGWQDFEVPELD